MAFTNPWTETEPTDNTSVRDTDNWFRRLSTAIRERLGIEHYTYADETDQTKVGKHKPGSARAYICTTTTKPTPDADVPGELAYTTDASTLIVNNGGTWVDAAPAVLHVARHKTGGADALAPADIGAATPANISTHAALPNVHVPSGKYVVATVNSDQSSSWTEIKSKPETFPPSAHTHGTFDYYINKTFVILTSSQQAEVSSATKVAEITVPAEDRYGTYQYITLCNLSVDESTPSGVEVYANILKSDGTWYTTSILATADYITTLDVEINLDALFIANHPIKMELYYKGPEMESSISISATFTLKHYLKVIA
jgi:hypothetical protein